MAQEWSRAEDFLADATPPTLVIDDTSYEPLLYAWDGTGAPAYEPRSIEWQRLPSIGGVIDSLDLEIESDHPPERVVFQMFTAVGPDGIPVGHSTEYLCTFDGVDDCFLDYDSWRGMLLIRLPEEVGRGGYVTAQLTWLLDLRGAEIGEVWATWGMVIGE